MNLLKIVKINNQESITLSFMKAFNDLKTVVVSHRDETTLNAFLQYILKEMSFCGLTCVILCGGKIEFTRPLNNVLVIAVKDKRGLLSALRTCEYNPIIRNTMVYIGRTENFASLVNSTIRRLEESCFHSFKKHCFIIHHEDTRYVYKVSTAFETDLRMSNLTIKNKKLSFSMLIDRDGNVDETSVLTSFGIQRGLIEKKGNWYRFEDLSIQGRVNFLDALDSNENFVCSLESKIKDNLRTSFLHQHEL